MYLLLYFWYIELVLLPILKTQEVIWIAFNSTQIKHWFYLKIEQNKNNNINNY